jgi:hypothetical protein
LIPLIVKDKNLIPIAYGIVTCCVNASLAMFPTLIAGEIRDDPTFYQVMMTLSAVAMAGSLAMTVGIGMHRT